MGEVLKGLEPNRVFHYFEEICNIPHGSYHVEKISQYLVDFAKEHDLEVVQDKELNVLIRKPASKGMEAAPVVILQGHMDMVCEKESDVTFDFLRDGLQLQVNGDDITATGTTLGGDDGIAVAYALAILEDDTLVHPELEVLITTQEETGMEGALGFDVEQLNGKYLINVDSEEEGVVLTSCAGGEVVEVDYSIQTEKPVGTCYEFRIHGLKGGHSGADIHFGRGNANVILAQMLYVFYCTGITYRVAKIDGGSKHNAIPRECKAWIYLNEEQLDAIKIVLKDFVTRVGQELAERDPNFQLDFGPSKDAFDWVMCGYITDAFADAAAHVTDGVCRMSMDVEGLVETSSNLGVLQSDGEKLHMEYLVRSSKQNELKRAVDVISYVMLQGAANYADRYESSIVDACQPQITRCNGYPGWAYKKDSQLRKLLLDVYEKQYGKPMKVEAIHAGLECGIFAGKKELDIISIGPDILDIHTPKETLKIASTARTYQLLIELLRRADEL